MAQSNSSYTLPPPPIFGTVGKSTGVIGDNSPHHLMNLDDIFEDFFPPNNLDSMPRLFNQSSSGGHHNYKDDDDDDDDDDDSEGGGDDKKRKRNSRNIQRNMTEEQKIERR